MQSDQYPTIDLKYYFKIWYEQKLDEMFGPEFSYMSTSSVVVGNEVLYGNIFTHQFIWQYLIRWRKTLKYFSKIQQFWFHLIAY